MIVKSFSNFGGIYRSPEGDGSSGDQTQKQSDGQKQEEQQTQKPADQKQDTTAQDNEKNALRRKLEAAEARAAQLEAAEAERQKANMSELEREKTEKTEAQKKADALAIENLRLKHGKNLPDDATELLTGTDEETIIAQAEKLTKLFGDAPPVRGGTITQPPGTQQPTAEEKINTALKNGKDLDAIRLMREAQGLK